MPAPPKKVDFKAVLEAHKDTAGKNVYYLDTKSGAVVNLSPTSPMSQLAAFKQRLAKEPDVLLKVPHITAEENYGDMDAFIKVIVDKKLQDRLRTAQSGGGTLRNFLDALESGHPRERDQWKLFRDQRVSGRLKNWLKENGINTP
ncbi:MAG TPA: UPF0158 family protein [Candidatus Xenobia bacterium]|jgi:hypothetical protein